MLIEIQHPLADSELQLQVQLQLEVEVLWALLCPGYNACCRACFQFKLVSS